MMCSVIFFGSETRVGSMIPKSNILDLKQQTLRTVDGSEIRRSPVEVGSLCHYLDTRFIHSRWLLGISEPSTVSTISMIHKCLQDSFVDRRILP